MVSMFNSSDRIKPVGCREHLRKVSSMEAVDTVTCQTAIELAERHGQSQKQEPTVFVIVSASYALWKLMIQHLVQWEEKEVKTRGKP